MLGNIWCIGYTKKRDLALKRRSHRKRKAARHREERFYRHSSNLGLEHRFRGLTQLHDGTCFRALTILDVYTWEGVVRVLKRLKRERRAPQLLF